MNTKPYFANFKNDHTTTLTDPTLYPIFYLFLRIIMCVPADRSGIVYDVQTHWRDDHTESMTYAATLGCVWTDKDEEQFQLLRRIIDSGVDVPLPLFSEFFEYFRQKRDADLLCNTLLAVVQPSEPTDMFSHVKHILEQHSTCAHVEHIAYETPDIRGFYNHAVARGLQFVTPIIYDKKGDLVQVFGGEFYHPWSEISSGLFLEFVERRPNPELREEGEHNREIFFRDPTFFALYNHKQAEYESGGIVPFISHDLFRKLYALVGHKKFWEITEDDVALAEKIMMAKN